MGSMTLCRGIEDRMLLYLGYSEQLVSIETTIECIESFLIMNYPVVLQRVCENVWELFDWLEIA